MAVTVLVFIARFLLFPLPPLENGCNISNISKKHPLDNTCNIILYYFIGLPATTTYH